MGCQILQGYGTGFYYVDWDEDTTIQNKPGFGLFDFSGKPKNGMKLDCDPFKPDTRFEPTQAPGFMGGNGMGGS